MRERLSLLLQIKRKILMNLAMIFINSIFLSATQLKLFLITPAIGSQLEKSDSLKPSKKLESEVEYHSVKNADNFVKLGCPNTGIPFFNKNPDRKKSVNESSGKFTIMYFGKNEVAAFKQQGNIKVRAVKIYQDKYPKDLTFIFKNDQQSIRNYLGSETCKDEKSELTCYFEGIESSIKFVKNVPSVIIWT